METVSNRSGAADTGVRRPGPGDRPARPPAAWARWLEALGVALSPAVAALLLRLRLMAPSDLPDPAMHTIYIVDPRQVFMRYAAVYEPTARLRESTRVGFLVPARLAYLAFGAAGGFFVLRYLLALLAVGPVYLLLRRLYGRPAGVVGLLVVLSSPVLVTAWGTDYPDSAVVSYAAGALACLAMPCSARWRRAWLAAAGVLLTAAVWSHGVAVPLVAATMAGYLGVRLVRQRAGLPGDLAVLAVAAAAVTAALIAASAVLIGHANFIATTWQAYRFLSQPSQVALWHSSNWRWAPYVAYLLVPPAVLAAFAAAVARRASAIATPVLMIGAMFVTQLAVYAGLQFFGTVQTLEEHYFSATLWAAVCLAFAVTVAELARPLSDRPAARWLPAAVLLAVPLCYEADPHVPSFGWAPLGVILAAAVIAAAVAARCCGRLSSPLAAAAGLGVTLTAFAGASLVLTVAPIPAHRALPGTVYDPPPAYATALGGGWAAYVDSYRIATALPLFAGPAAYPGQQILTWWPVSDQSPSPFTEYAGMYHGKFNTLPSDPPDLTRAGRAMLRARRPAEVLLYDTSAATFPAALRTLSHFRPAVVRTTVLRSGPEVLHVWLIRLARYYGASTP